MRVLYFLLFFVMGVGMFYLPIAWNFWKGSGHSLYTYFSYQGIQAHGFWLVYVVFFFPCLLTLEYAFFNYLKIQQSITIVMVIQGAAVTAGLIMEIKYSFLNYLPDVNTFGYMGSIPLPGIYSICGIGSIYSVVAILMCFPRFRLRKWLFRA